MMLRKKRKRRGYYKRDGVVTRAAARIMAFSYLIQTTFRGVQALSVGGVVLGSLAE